jgi:hypothetical protein
MGNLYIYIYIYILTALTYVCALFIWADKLIYLYFKQLKYHDSGREKDCLPRVGQWNMMNKVWLFSVKEKKYFYIAHTKGLKLMAPPYFL